MLKFFSQGILVNLSIWKDVSCLSCGFFCHICMLSPRVPFRSVRSILRQGKSLKGLNRRVRKVTAEICALLKICSKRNLTSVCFFLCTPIITSNLSKSWALLKLWNSHLKFKKHLLVIMDISVQIYGYGYQNVNMTQIWIHSIWPVTATHLEGKQKCYVSIYFSHMLTFYNLILLRIVV